MNTYRLKFYKGRKLIVEHAFEIDPETDSLDAFKHNTVYDSAQMIEEAIDCNEGPTAPQYRQD